MAMQAAKRANIRQLKSTEFCISEIRHIKSQLKKCIIFLENMDPFDKSECIPKNGYKEKGKLKLLKEKYGINTDPPK